MTGEPLSPDTRRYLEAALAACRRAGEIHREHFRSAALRVDLKADASPVTVADRASEEAIRETLHRATPELGLLGEEFGQEGSERDRWIIDPIDATKSFVAGLPFFATLIGLELDGELVFGTRSRARPGTGLGAVRVPAPGRERRPGGDLVGRPRRGGLGRDRHHPRDLPSAPAAGERHVGDREGLRRSRRPQPLPAARPLAGLLGPRRPRLPHPRLRRLVGAHPGGRGALRRHAGGPRRPPRRGGPEADPGRGRGRPPHPRRRSARHRLDRRSALGERAGSRSRCGS